MHDFNFTRPTSVAEAVRAISKTEDGQYLAGGQTVIPVLKQRLAQPTDLIDLGKVDGLANIELGSDGISIGAMTTHAKVANSKKLAKTIPALCELAGMIGDPHVRNLGTIGGSVANNDPAADYPAALVGLGAKVVTDRREISADEFFEDLFETALEDDELITSVHFRIPDRAAYMKFPNPASRYAIVGVFISQLGEDVRVAVTGAGPCVFRVTEMEAALAAHFSPEVIDGMTVPENDLNSDIHASAEYRAHLVAVMAKRAVSRATAVISDE